MSTPTFPSQPAAASAHACTAATKPPKLRFSHFGCVSISADVIVSHHPCSTAKSKYLVSPAMLAEPARFFGIQHMPIPAVVDDFGNLVAVPA